jgi:hypothetical protein
MSDTDTDSKRSYASTTFDIGGMWVRFKWLLPVLITLIVVISLIARFAPIVNLDGSYISFAFAIAAYFHATRLSTGSFERLPALANAASRMTSAAFSAIM